MSDDITLTSASRQEDAALRALADVSRAVPDWAHCRVVGGHMVTVHLVRSGAAAEHRPTADADLAAALVIIRQDEFADRLIRQLGYAKTDGSRLARETDDGPAYIDLVAPAPAGRALHNQREGAFSVDKFPGIQYALNASPTVVDITAVPLEGEPYGTFRIAVPSLTAAIVVKALAASARSRDKGDLDLLFAAADASKLAFPSPPYDNIDVGAAAAYLHGPYLFGASQHTRALLERIVPRPPERPHFLDL